MASRLDTKPSKIGPSAQARYARRSMRKFSRRGDAESLAKAGQQGAILDDLGEGDTVRSSEGRVAADALQNRYDEQVIREQEAALAGPQRPAAASETSGATSTQRNLPQALQDSAGVRLPEPEPGITAPPVNKLTEASTPSNVADFRRGRINKLTGRPFGAIPEAGQPSLDDRLAAYQRKYLGGGDITSALRESSAKHAAEANRLRASSTPTPATSLRPSEPLIPVPAPDAGFPIDDEEAFTPSAAPTNEPRPATLPRLLGQVAGRQIRDVGASALTPGYRTLRGAARSAADTGLAADRLVRPPLNVARGALRDTRLGAGVVRTGANALLDRVRSGLGEARRGLTGE